MILNDSEYQQNLGIYILFKNQSYAIQRFRSNKILKRYPGEFQKDLKESRPLELGRTRIISSFLQENANHSKGQRLFKRMSQIIGTRTPSQCRSHHQKFNPSKPTIKITQTRLLKTKQLVRLYMQKHKVKDEEEE